MRVAIDAAVVLLSNLEGPPAMVELADAGKHIVGEKPGTGTLADAQAILDAVERSGVTFAMAYQNRYSENAGRLKQMIANGQFGKVISIENISVTTDVRLRLGGGNLADPHYLFDPAQNKMEPGAAPRARTAA